MLSKKAKYAIKALLALAAHEGEEPMRIADLARAEHIPPKFLEAILLALRNQGILRSRKGRGGGYLLARKPSEIHLGQIVRMFDGPLAPVPCASQTASISTNATTTDTSTAVRVSPRTVDSASEATTISVVAST